MYANKNYTTKKELVTDVKARKQVGVHQPGGFFPGKTDGTVCIEGPHYPKPHKWYAEAVIKDSIIVKVK